MSGTQYGHRSSEPFFKVKKEPVKRGANGFPIGPRTIRRQKENAKLRKEVGTKHCELGSVLRELFGVNVCNGYASCWAHSQKSRHLTTSKDWQEAAHSCIPCHDYIEPLGKNKMKAIVLAAIAKRKPKGEYDYGS